MGFEEARRIEAIRARNKRREQKRQAYMVAMIALAVIAVVFLVSQLVAGFTNWPSLIVCIICALGIVIFMPEHDDKWNHTTKR